MMIEDSDARLELMKMMIMTNDHAEERTTVLLAPLSLRLEQGLAITLS